MNSDLGYCISAIKDLILCKYLLIGATIESINDDFCGIDILYKNDKIDTKYSSLNNGFIWFEKNKLEDYFKIKTTRIMLFLNGINEYVDTSRSQILSIINHANSLHDEKICYITLSRHIKTDDCGNEYQDELCYIKYDWIKQYYANVINKTPSNIVNYFQLAFKKIISMNSEDIHKLKNSILKLKT